MTVQERTTILEAADILKALGGNNGFGNLQPKIKSMLRGYANQLIEIVKNDSTPPATAIPPTSAKEEFLLNH